jgi:hypothetical protein
LLGKNAGRVYYLWDYFISFFPQQSPPPLHPPGASKPDGNRSFSPLRRNEKNYWQVVSTGSVSHALQVVNLVPYSQYASCTTLGNTPNRCGFSLIKENDEVIIDEINDISTESVMV